MEPEQTYPEQLARRILARAIEVDQVRGDSYSLSELRSIAAEAGVSDVALEQALRELQPRLPGVEQTHSNRIALATVAAAGTTVGAIAGITDVTTYFVSSPLAMGLLLMISGAVAVAGDYRKPMRGFVRFQVRNTSLWLVYAATWTLTAMAAGGAGTISTVVLERTVVLGWTLSTVFGSVVSAYGAWRNRSASSADGTEATIPLKRRIADRLKAWLDTWASRVAVAEPRATATAETAAG